MIALKKKEKIETGIEPLQLTVRQWIIGGVMVVGVIVAAVIFSTILCGYILALVLGITTSDFASNFKLAVNLVYTIPGLFIPGTVMAIIVIAGVLHSQ